MREVLFVQYVGKGGLPGQCQWSHHVSARCSTERIPADDLTRVLSAYDDFGGKASTCFLQQIHDNHYPMAFVELFFSGLRSTCWPEIQRDPITRAVSER